MSAIYRLDWRKPDGSRYAQAINYRWLSLRTGVHQVGMLRGEFDGGLAWLSSIEHLDLVELWRADPENDVEWYRFFSGEYIAPRWTRSGDNQNFEFSVAGDLRKLKTREVLWRAGTISRSKFLSDAGETIMKTMVAYNCTSLASVINGRLVDGTITGVSVATDLGRGNTVNWYCFGDNLLESLRDLARIAGGDFDLVKTGDAAWEFEFYPGQLGTDRTDTVLFAVEQNNMAEPEYSVDRWDEATVAAVGGRGDDSAREFRVRYGSGYSAANHAESFVNATNVELGDLDGLDAMADKELSRRAAREEFKFKVLQTKGCRFGVHYGLGDLVTVRNPFTGTTSVQKVSMLYLGLKSTGQETETIDVDLVTP